VAVMVAQAGVSSTRKRRFLSSTILVAAGTATAAILGAGLGLVGAAFGPVPLAVVVSVAACALVAGVVSSERPWQIDRETPGKWLEYHDWRTVALNGAALGAGFTTRIGYWAWYVLPLAAFALAKPQYGAVILATYAFTRLTLSAGLTARLKPGSTTAWKKHVTGAVDSAAIVLLSILVLNSWLESLST
jgi:hypothetical protein